MNLIVTGIVLIGALIVIVKKFDSVLGKCSFKKVMSIITVWAVTALILIGVGIAQATGQEFVAPEYDRVPQIMTTQERNEWLACMDQHESVSACRQITGIN